MYGAQEATANCTIGLPCVVDLMAFDEALMMPWQEVTVSELLIVPVSGCLGPPSGLWVDRSTPQAHPRFQLISRPAVLPMLLQVASCSVTTGTLGTLQHGLMARTTAGKSHRSVS